VNANSLYVLRPYKHEGSWVFDDDAVGLRREPFVLGVDVMIERLVAAIPNATAGFRLIFSSRRFPGYAAKLEWRREEEGGNWYFSPTFGIEGWLCPALLKYFHSAPEELYARAEALELDRSRNRAAQAHLERQAWPGSPMNQRVLSAEEFERLLPLAAAWAGEQEARILASGVKLTPAQLSDARQVGVSQPEQIRLLAVPSMPVPQDPVLRAACGATGLISSATSGLALRYGICVRNDVVSDRFLVAHELAHTAQYERFGSIISFLRQYLQECFTFGYPAGPLEQEAVVASERLRHVPI
jgi:hypothetical protein